MSNLPPNLSQVMRADLEGIMPMLGSQELAVLRWLAVRLLQGQSTYGKLDVATDTRDFTVERSEEIADMLIYCGIEELKRTVAKG